MFFIELYLFVLHSNWKQSHVFQKKSETLKIFLKLLTYKEQIFLFPDHFSPTPPLVHSYLLFF